MGARKLRGVYMREVPAMTPDWRQLRMAAAGLGLTRRELARLSGVSLPCVQNALSGKVNTTIPVMRALIHVLTSRGAQFVGSWVRLNDDTENI